MTAILTQSQDERHLNAFYIYLCILCLAPWPMGSSRDWVWPILTIAQSGLALYLMVRATDALYNIRAEIRLILIAFAALTAWMTIQLLFTPDLYNTYADILKTVTFGAFVFNTYQLIKSRDRLMTVINALLIVGVCQVVLAAIQHLGFGLKASGSYPNRNHYGGLLEMTVALGIGFMVAQQPIEKKNEPWLVSLLELITGPKARLRLMLVMLVIGLVISRSRGANMAFVLSLLLASGVFFFMTRRIQHNTIIFLVSILVVDALIIGNYFGIEKLKARFENSTPQTETRDDINQYSRQMAEDYWLTGAGAGSYEIIFPHYRGNNIEARITNAENDYLEFLIELGIIGVIPLALIVVIGLRQQLRQMSPRRDRFNQGIAFGCLMGSTAILMHGVGDFNLQIPANAMIFCLLLTLPLCHTDASAS